MIGSPVAFSIVTSTPGSPRTATPNVDPIQNGKTMKNKRTPNTEIVPTWRTRTGQWWLYRIPPNDGRHSRQVLHANRRDQMAYGKANSTPPCGRTRSSSRKRYAMDQISSVSPRIVPRVERQVGTARELASATAPPAIPAPAVANGIAIIGSIPIALAMFPTAEPAAPAAPISRVAHTADPVEPRVVIQSAAISAAMAIPFSITVVLPHGWQAANSTRPNRMQSRGAAK